MSHWRQTCVLINIYIYIYIFYSIYKLIKLNAVSSEMFKPNLKSFQSITFN